MANLYFEKCVQRLPLDKQAAARDAYTSIAENGDDSLISKFLFVLSVCTDAILAEIVTAGEKLTREVSTSATALPRAQADYQKRMEEIIAPVIAQQMSETSNSPALGTIIQLLKKQEADIQLLHRDVARLRHVRFHGLFFVMMIGAAVGAAAVVGFFRSNYHKGEKAREFMSMLHSAGIDAQITITETGALLTVNGPKINEGTKWRKDSQGQVYGVDLVFSQGGSR